jgi:hypothetical protein
VLQGLKVARKSGFEGTYGYVYVTKFEGPNGEAISHLGTPPRHPNGSELQIGDVVALQATVKRHSDYQGVKETIVSRPKIIAAPEPEAKFSRAKRTVSLAELGLAQEEAA